MSVVYHRAAEKPGSVIAPWNPKLIEIYRIGLNDEEIIRADQFIMLLAVNALGRYGYFSCGHVVPL